MLQCREDARNAQLHGAHFPGSNAARPSMHASKSAVKRAQKLADAAAAALAQYIAYFGSPSEAFGPRMVASLAPALAAPSPPCALLNRFASATAQAAFFAEAGSPPPLRVPGLLPELRAFTRDSPFPRIGAANGNDVLAAYHLDAASLLAVCALAPARGARVLDMCAAPGGKSLAIAQLLGCRGVLTANDSSPGRRRRLREVLSLYLPRRGSGGGSVGGDGDGGEDDDAQPPLVRLAAADATHSGAFGAGAYDAVLLDAPCSSDRHLLSDAAELARWGPGRIRGNAARQAALLSAALVAVRPGGAVVYATCALSRRENDAVVARVLAATPGAAALAPLRFAFGEPTALGAWQVLPDSPGGGLMIGCGPLYIAKLLRLS